MTELDVSQLANESLSRNAFPANMASDFRLFIDPEVHSAIAEHAGEDTSIEICGVLVGQWEHDDDGPFARVSNRIRCDNASSKLAEVTFTHESWAQINQEMDSKYDGQRIIGWYHSHPDFGIFLSDRDLFIQEHFFSGAGQVALVVDPVRKLEGIFEWRDGKTSLMSHYWIGDRIQTRAASGVDAKSDTSTSSTSATAAQSEGVAQRTAPRESTFSITTTAMAWLCLFLLGYLVSGQSSRWQESMIREGAVAHYGVWNLMHTGWENDIRETSAELDAVAKEVKRLSDSHISETETERAALRKQWLNVRRHIAAAHTRLKRAQSRYSLSDEEKRALAIVTSMKVAELSGVHDNALQPIPPNLPVENGTSSAGSSSKENRGAAAPGKSGTGQTGKSSGTRKQLGPKLPD